MSKIIYKMILDTDTLLIAFVVQLSKCSQVFRSKISLNIYNFIVVYDVFQMVDLRVTIDKLF